MFTSIDQPDKKNVDFFRLELLEECFLASLARLPCQKCEAERYEIIRFVQGYSTVEKAGGALVQGVADVATFGLWAIVGTPAEAILAVQRDGVRGFIRSGQ